MAKFLNTDSLNEWIPRLIRETERELVIIVPYIKTSQNVFAHLFEANKRGVETTIVYRENKLSPQEKAKLESLDNLNLMHHPNVHAKCYLNEKYMILASINLYEYSEKNNREMGILLLKENEEFMNDDEAIFEDAVAEIRAIINGSLLEKKSRETIELGFEMDIIKTPKEKIEEDCKKLNKAFVHKRFEPHEINEDYYCVCKNYFDKIDVAIDYRAFLILQMDEKRVELIFNKCKPFITEYRFTGFKFYWNKPDQRIYLYVDGRHEMWKGVSEENEVNLMKKGIDELIVFLRPHL